MNALIPTTAGEANERSSSERSPGRRYEHGEGDYILYLVGIAVGVTAIVGVIMAYVYRDNAPDWLKTHYQLQIRTFWMMVLYSCIAFILVFVLIGFVMFLAIAVWWIIRCVKGLKALEERNAYPNPLSWGF